MGSPLFILISYTIAIFILLTLHHYAGAGAMELKVGDSQGWIQPPQNQTTIYNQWASRNRFHVGDSLWFQYNNDSVLVVDKFDYYHCNSATPTAAYGDGNTTVRLDKPGPAYFISGNISHCMNGQRIVVQVMAIRPDFYSHPPESYGVAVAPSPSMSGSPAVDLGSLVLASIVVAISVALA
ncbi:mavicyanin-like [Impatiens glandulifera]|uniref:mavicyanin-like n=1 Tax=Impatiens glandulifera TaxID=253017 RepID=UPI001FB0BD87|nr:mavicyanin-like [Impatiens glandulifera]